MKRKGTCSLLLLYAALLLVALRVTALEPPAGIGIPELRAEFYPIGWSPDGSFAYALVDEPLFRGGYGFLCAIVNARTDEVLWLRYDHSDQFDWEGDAVPLSIAWQRNVSAISEQLDAFGVEPVGAARVEPLPLRRGVDEYTAEVNEWRVNPETSPYGNGVVGYTLRLRSRQHGTKVIAQRAHIFATDIVVHGYIQSPFENRIVLLVAESGNAYGDARFTDFRFIGAHLEAGFE